jgi:hypothetical protein
LMNDDDVEDVGPGGGKEGGKGDEEAREQHQVILEIVLGAWLCQSLPCFVCFDRMYLRLFDGRTLGSRKILRQQSLVSAFVARFTVVGARQGCKYLNSWSHGRALVFSGRCDLRIQCL